MENTDVDKIWNEVVTEAGNRSKGSFKRALWYGTTVDYSDKTKVLVKLYEMRPKR